MRVINLFDIQIQAATMPEVLQQIGSAVKSRQPLNIGVVNAAKIVNMQRDPELAMAVRSSDVIYADGMSVVWASRLLGSPLPERIAGIDLMHEIMACANVEGFRVFCLGATQEVLNRVIKSFNEQYPTAIIAGMHHGYFDENEEQKIATEIRDSRADVLLVAITSPKKERFMAKWASTMNVPVVHGVGGSFDVVAGLVERAPSSWQKLGLEWLYRVKQEPRRLWRRYLFTNLSFLKMLMLEKARLVRTR